jgi:hypothetical protein
MLCLGRLSQTRAPSHDVHYGKLAPRIEILILHLRHSSARSVEGAISDFDPGDREVRCAPGADMPRGYLA